MDLGLRGKVAVVTGAGRGIGRAIVMTLAAEGARAAINDFYRERAEAVANEIAAAGGDALPIQADVTSKKSVDAMVKKILDTWGRLDILVNNAGIPAGMLEALDPGIPGVPFMQMTPEEWNKWISLNLIGVFNCCRAALDPMVQQNRGRIVSIVSDAGRIGQPGQSVYSAAKAGIIGFSKALAKETARFKITVNCVAPGETWGTYVSDLAGSREPQTEEQKETRQKLLRLYPLARSMNRLGLPEDLANAVAYFVSDGAEWVTGQVLSVNGGFCMVD